MKLVSKAIGTGGRGKGRNKNNLRHNWQAFNAPTIKV